MIPAVSLDSVVRPYAWSTEQYLALLETGIVAEDAGLELVSGQVVETMSQGELHWFMFAALQRAFASMGAFEAGLAVQPTVVLEPGNVFDPEFAFFRKDVIGKLGLPTGADVVHVIEVSVTSRSQDLGVKKSAYASAGIPHYWVVDGLKRGIWAFSNPIRGVYEDERFIPVGGEIDVPELGKTLALATIFPAIE